MSEFLERILEWGESEEPVRLLVLEGSRLDPNADDLADYDINVFSRDCSIYLESDAWLEKLAPVWVCVHDEFDWDELKVFTRLVIFAGGIKVDFSFHSAAWAARAGGAKDYQGGYCILLDKDGLAAGWSPSNPRPLAPERPGQPRCTNLVEEFWFEAYHIAKYLRRDELWLVKFRDWGVKELLLQMIEWNEQARAGWKADTQYLGKHMQAWISPDTWGALAKTFAHFDAADSRAALRETIDLFAALGRETAARLGLVYPEAVERNLRGWIIEQLSR